MCLFGQVKPISIAIVCFHQEEVNSINRLLVEIVCTCLEKFRESIGEIKQVNCYSSSNEEAVSSQIDILRSSQIIIFITPIWNWSVPWQVKRLLDNWITYKGYSDEESEGTSERRCSYIVQTLGGKNREFFYKSNFTVADYLIYVFRRIGFKHIEGVCIEELGNGKEKKLTGDALHEITNKVKLSLENFMK